MTCGQRSTCPNLTLLNCLSYHGLLPLVDLSSGLEFNFLKCYNIRKFTYFLKVCAYVKMSCLFGYNGTTLFLKKIFKQSS